jgi:uncharacterized protein YutE (UPF0331/DUF86 family)
VTAEQVQTRLDVLRANLEKLARIPQESFEVFTGDFRNLEAALHLLQTSIQALIDLGSILLARNALPTPRTSHEVFEHLERGGLLPPGSAQRLIPIVAFRNRVVHLYDRIDERRVYEILTRHRRDLTDLLELILAVLDQE